jgi:hypothetical protein
MMTNTVREFLEAHLPSNPKWVDSSALSWDRVAPRLEAAPMLYCDMTPTLDDTLIEGQLPYFVGFRLSQAFFDAVSAAAGHAKQFGYACIELDIQPYEMDPLLRGREEFSWRIRVTGHGFRVEATNRDEHKFSVQSSAACLFKDLAVALLADESKLRVRNDITGDDDDEGDGPLAWEAGALIQADDEHGRVQEMSDALQIRSLAFQAMVLAAKMRAVVAQGVAQAALAPTTAQPSAPHRRPRMGV